MTEIELKTAREAYYNSRIADYTLRIINTTSLQTKKRLENEMKEFKKDYYLKHFAKHKAE